MNSNEEGLIFTISVLFSLKLAGSAGISIQENSNPKTQRLGPYVQHALDDKPRKCFVWTTTTLERPTA